MDIEWTFGNTESIKDTFYLNERYSELSEDHYRVYYKLDVYYYKAILESRELPDINFIYEHFNNISSAIDKFYQFVYDSEILELGNEYTELYDYLSKVNSFLKNRTKKLIEISMSSSDFESDAEIKNYVSDIQTIINEIDSEIEQEDLTKQKAKIRSIINKIPSALATSNRVAYSQLKDIKSFHSQSQITYTDIVIASLKDEVYYQTKENLLRVTQVALDYAISENINSINSNNANGMLSADNISSQHLDDFIKKISKDPPTGRFYFKKGNRCIALMFCKDIGKQYFSISGKELLSDKTYNINSFGPISTYIQKELTATTNEVFDFAPQNEYMLTFAHKETDKTYSIYQKPHFLDSDPNWEQYIMDYSCCERKLFSNLYTEYLTKPSRISHIPKDLEIITRFIICTNCELAIGKYETDNQVKINTSRCPI